MGVLGQTPDPAAPVSDGPALCYSSSWLITLTLEECRKSCFDRIMLMNYYCWVLIQCKYTLGNPFWVIKHNAFLFKKWKWLSKDPISWEWITFLAISSRTLKFCIKTTNAMKFSKNVKKDSTIFPWNISATIMHL